MNYRCCFNPYGCSLYLKASLWIQGKTPKTKVGVISIAAGVVSETWDYTEGPPARLYFSYAAVKTFFAAPTLVSKLTQKVFV
jgi:hypothetical protein